jgi:hypothetical protein
MGEAILLHFHATVLIARFFRSNTKTRCAAKNARRPWLSPHITAADRETWHPHPFCQNLWNIWDRYLEKFPIEKGGSEHFISSSRKGITRILWHFPSQDPPTMINWLIRSDKNSGQAASERGTASQFRSPRTEKVIVYRSFLTQSFDLQWAKEICHSPSFSIPGSVSINQFSQDLQNPINPGHRTSRNIRVEPTPADRKPPR